MFNTSELTKAKTGYLPEDATFFWRCGRWEMHVRGAVASKPVALRYSKMLDELKRMGKLEEKAPGLFRVAGALSHPAVDGAESPLLRLSQMKQSDGKAVLDGEQVRAGERLRLDYERAHLGARVTMSYDVQCGSSGRQAQFSDNHIEKLNDSALEARDRLHEALESVGPELSGILLHVCCMAGGLEQAELRLNLPRRAGKAVLQLALTRLARHYGFKTALRHGGPAKIGHWAVGDFRPGLAVQSLHQL
jgi:Domain of unknown function (DUF6456)